MYKLTQFLLIGLLGICVAHADRDGRWQLVISGQDRIEFGTEHLAGGLHIHWQTDLEFLIKHGRFVQGTGTAQLDSEITSYSRPESMFECNQIKGSFVSRNGILFATPHLRFQAFPVAGKVVEENIHLNPSLAYPGNYYAVLYKCLTRDDLGSFWLENSPRIARELGKRQDSTLKTGEDGYQASIREVKTIAPGPEIVLPLKEGFEFSLSEDYGLRQLNYRLQRLE